MERAILKTIIYSDIFDYPLKAWEIHKWLISGTKSELKDVEYTLRKLVKKGVVIEKDGFYALSGRNRLFRKRQDKIKASQKFFREARIISSLFKLIPWVLLVGVSGNLAMENADAEDDIDLFVITRKNRLWISRLLILFILALLEKRRSKKDFGKSAAGKFCVNLMLEEDQLEQQNKDLYISHEVLQMKPLWDREGIYANFLESNMWVFGYLANWLAAPMGGRPLGGKKNNTSKVINFVEEGVQFLQRRYMGKPSQAEKVYPHAVYFHPEDNRMRVLRDFEQRCKKYLKR